MNTKHQYLASNFAFWNFAFFVPLKILIVIKSPTIKKAFEQIIYFKTYHINVNILLAVFVKTIFEIPVFD